MRIDQVLVAAVPGDAISNSAFDALRTLRAGGVSSEIYARHIDPRLTGDVLPLTTMPDDGDADGGSTLVYHGAIGEPDVVAFLRARPERLALMYHNVSPPEPFEPYDRVFAGPLRSGREEIAGLAARVDVAFAASQFNASELEAMGYRDVRVAPLSVDTRRLLDVEPDPDTMRHLTTQMDGPVILAVGQVLPHKRPDFLVAAFHALVTWLVPVAHLVIVGPARIEEYRRSLQHFISELNLTTTWVTGEVTDAELAAFLRRADMLATASEHEGFCAPLLEAMAFDVPIIARDFAAVPETLDGAALLLPPDASPLVAAEAMAALGDVPLRDVLVAAGRRRLDDVTSAANGRHLADQLLAGLG